MTKSCWRLADAAADVAVGEDGYYGALNNAQQLARVAGMVDRRGPHTELVAGGTPLARDGFFYPPTVVAGVRADDELATEEVFGPVITVQRVEDETDALRAANATRYGLAASVWTTDHGRAMRCAKALDFGAVWLNCHSVLATEMPHGATRPRASAATCRPTRCANTRGSSTWSAAWGELPTRALPLLLAYNCAV